MVAGSSFKASEGTIDSAFFADRRFRIPRYQRPYAWEIDHVTDFWSDVIAAGDSPFIGSLIFNHESVEKTGCIEIIDGQQRLLTVTIMLAAVRDVARSIDMGRAEFYHRHDIVMEDRRTAEKTYRILANDGAQDYFRSNIQDWSSNALESNPRTREERRMKANYAFLHERLKGEVAKYADKIDQLARLDDLRKRVGDLTVIEVRIDDEEAAYEIFEGTNARGVDLSVSDLLKNLIFKNLPPKEDLDTAKDIWEEISNNVEATNTDMKRFIRYFWISKEQFVTERRLFRVMKRETTNHLELLMDLGASSEFYNMIMESSKDDWNGIKHGYKIFESIASVRIMGVSQCYVLFLSILRNLDKMGTDPTWIFRLVEKFTFRYSVVCKLPGNKVERIYSRYAKDIEEAVATAGEKQVSGKVQSVFTALAKELQQESPPANQFQDGFSTLSYKNSEQSRMLMKYVLGQLNSHYKRTREERIDFDEVNIEHILPKNPDKLWNLTSKDVREYVNLLGNLTLVDKRINSKIGNSVMSEKIKDLRRSELAITKTLVGELENSGHHWDEECIKRRQGQFAELASDEIWNL